MTSTLKVDTVQASTPNGSITLKGEGTGSVLLPTGIVYSANVTGNVSVSRSLAVGYTDGRVPQANLEVKGNTHITGKLTSSSVTPAFYGANVTGNISVSRSLAVGYVDGRVPQANLDVTGNTALAGAVTLFDNSLIRANLKDYGPVLILSHLVTQQQVMKCVLFH